MVDQNARAVLELADHGYILENGMIVRDGPHNSCSQTPRCRNFISVGAAAKTGARAIGTSSNTGGRGDGGGDADKRELPALDVREISLRFGRSKCCAT